AWDHIATTRGPQVLDRSDVVRIDWEDDPEDGGSAAPSQGAPTAALWGRPDGERVAEAAARQFVRQAARAIRRRGRCAVALGGAGALQPLYPLLAHQSHAKSIDWKKVHLFWGDECCVAPDHANSQYRASQAFLNAVPLPADNVHRIPGEQGPEKAA